MPSKVPFAYPQVIRSVIQFLWVFLTYQMIMNLATLHYFVSLALIPLEDLQLFVVSFDLHQTIHLDQNLCLWSPRFLFVLILSSLGPFILFFASKIHCLFLIFLLWILFLQVITLSFIILMLSDVNLIFITSNYLLIFLLHFLCALFLLHELFYHYLLLVNSLIPLYAFLAFTYEFMLH